MASIFNRLGVVFHLVLDAQMDSGGGGAHCVLVRFAGCLGVRVLVLGTLKLLLGSFWCAPGAVWVLLGAYLLLGGARFFGFSCLLFSAFFLYPLGIVILIGHIC